MDSSTISNESATRAADCARLQLPGEGMRIVFASLVAIRFLITRNIIRR